MTWALIILSWVWGGGLSQTTPVPTPTIDVTPVVEEASDTPPFEALTQADLSVITGNVQRPNGMVWLSKIIPRLTFENRKSRRSKVFPIKNNGGHG